MKTSHVIITSLVVIVLLAIISKQAHTIKEQRELITEYYDSEYDGNPYYENPDTILTEE